MKVDKNKVLVIRARNCISIADMRNAGLTQGNLNAIWNQRSMRPETVGKIARALNVDVSEILLNE